MTIDELKSYINEKITELSAVTLAHRFGDSEMANIAVILLGKILAGLNHLESDSIMLCRKCGDGELVVGGDWFDEGDTWFCRKCGAIHDVKTIRTCELAPEPEEDDG